MCQETSGFFKTTLKNLELWTKSLKWIKAFRTFTFNTKHWNLLSTEKIVESFLFYRMFRNFKFKTKKFRLN